MIHHNYKELDITGFTLIPAKNPALSLDADCGLEEFNRKVDTLQENCQSNQTVMKVMLIERYQTREINNYTLLLYFYL